MRTSIRRQRVGLVEARRLRGWSQKELAEHLGTTQVNVSRWERGLTTPTLYFRSKLMALFKKSLSELGLLLEETDEETENVVSPNRMASVSLPTPSPSLWNIPYRRNPFFTGREDILAHLHSCLRSNKTAVLTQTLAISGLGGMGKTQTAVEYAYRSRNDYQAIFWLRAETHDLLVAEVVSLATVLDVPEKSEQNQQHVVAGVTRWLNTHENWLLIVDNIEDMKVLHDVLPCAGGGSTLLTTRTQSTGTFATCIALEQMEPEEGAFFLLRRAKRIAPDAFLEEKTTLDYEMAKEISSLMDGLPLALDQAGAYIEETGCNLSDYLERYQHHHTTLLDLRGKVCESHPLSVRATLSLCLEQLEQINSTAADILRLCAFLHPDAIPEEMCLKGTVYSGFALERPDAHPITLDTAIAALRTLSLLRRHPETKSVSMHRLVQTVVKDVMDEGEQRHWAERAVQVVNHLFPTVQSDVQDLHHWVQPQTYLPHALVATQLIDKWHLTFSEANQLLHKVGLYFFARAEYTQAEVLLQKAKESHVQSLGEIHSKTAESFNALGDLFYYQSKYEQAEIFLQQALWIREQVVDATHPDIASNLSKLARLYQEQGQYRQAEPLLQRALTIHEQNVGPEHPDVADVLNSLGFLHRRQGKLMQAEPLLRRALTIYEQSLGPEHPDVLFSLTYLASLFYDQGKYKQAEDYYLRTLTMREHVMGQDHPHVATSLNDVARVFRVQGKYAQAEPLFQRAVAIYTNTVGEQHPYTATSLMNLAVLYREMDRSLQAEVLLHQAKAIYEKTVGDEHPRVAQCLNELATLHMRQGQDELAERAFQKALEIRTFQLGREHPETRATLAQYVNLLRRTNREEEAARLEVHLNVSN